MAPSLETKISIVSKIALYILKGGRATSLIL